MKSYQELFAELKRRKVFKVSAVYGVVAFGLIQVADPLTNTLLLPDTFLTYVVAILLLGFPLALVLAWAFEVTPDGVQRTGVAAPGEIEAIVSAPASQRWPAGLLALAGAAALLAGGWWVGQRASDAGATGAEAGLVSGVRLVDLAEDLRPSIAVLPFADMSPDGDQEYFSDGMTEEVLNVLAKITELRVAARTSAFAYKGRDMDLRVVGDSLGVGYIVEGSVRKDGERLRITAQLIDTADGSHLWSDSYNRTLDDVFAIQTEIAEAIASALRVPLGLDATELVHPTADLEAYDLYLAGRGHIRGRGQGLNEAIGLFEAAIARDSTWAPAWAALAEATELLTWYPDVWDGGRPDELADLTEQQRTLQAASRQAAERALRLDPSAVSAHVALGSVHRYRHQWRESEAAYLRALEIDPDNPEAFQQYGEMLEDVGRIAEAVRSSLRALDLDDAPVRHLQYGSSLAGDGRWEEALEQIRLSLDRDMSGSLIQTRDTWFWLNLEAGRYETMYELAPDRFADASESIEEALRTGDVSVLPADLVNAAFWMITGHPDSAAVALLEDVTTDPGWVGWIWTETFDGLRDQPAYLEALRLINLEGRTPQRTPR